MDFIKLTDSGLQVATRADIYSQLAMFARAAYGDDLSLDAGTPFDVFLGLLADGLSTVAGAAQSVTELFSTKELSGTYLDFIAGQRGIVRKSQGNQTVVMTVTCDSSVDRPFLAARNSIYVKDNKRRTWVNTTQLMIQRYKFNPDGTFDSDAENLQGTCEFALMPLNGYDAELLYAYNDGNVSNPLTAVSPTDPSIIDHFTFQNYVNATAAVQATENDAQFRARYDQAVYKDAVGTVEGLRAQLLNFTDFVRVVENDTNSSAVNASSNPYGLSAHSIWVIVGGGSTANRSPSVSTDASDVAIAQTILNYKSLGCGVSVSNDVVGGTIEIDGETYNTGNFLVEIPVETITAQIPFTRLVEKTVKFAVELFADTFDQTIRNSVQSQVSEALQSYVASLQPGDVITTAAVVSAIQDVLSQFDVGLFDFSKCTTTYSIGDTSSSKGIQVYEKAVGGVATVTFKAFS